MKMKLFRMVSILLVVSALLSTVVMADGPENPEAYASNYLDSYSAYCYAAGGGKVEVYFSVTADWYFKDVGATAVHLYESVDGKTWNVVKSFRYNYYPSMMGHDVIQHNSSVTYHGVAGRYYKANVSVWAGEGGDKGDNRHYMTSSIRAK